MPNVWYRAPHKRLCHLIDRGRKGSRWVNAGGRFYYALCGKELLNDWYSLDRFVDSPPLDRCCPRCLAIQEAKP